jgi:hypothetical protein
MAIAGDYGVRQNNKPHQHGFYPTPSYATEALLEQVKFTGNVWEPACGKGDMAKTLRAAGYSVTATDLHDRGFGRSGIDFLEEKGPKSSDNIITNPPFSLAEDFVRVGLVKSRRKLALFLRLAFLESMGRYEDIFTCTPLAKVIVFSQRVTLMPPIRRANGKMKATSATAYAWFVWDHKHKGPPTLHWTGAVK